MSKRKTTEEFIKECISLYGECVYDFSKAKYLQAHEKIKIKCIQHNRYFDITPSHFLNKKTSCVKCIEQKKRKIDKWNIEKLKKEAKKYNTLSDFHKNSSGAYMSAYRRNLLNDMTIFGHMVTIRNINGYWTEERCQEEALKYKSISEFRRNCSSAYNASKKLGILYNICKLMPPIGNILKRCVYKIIFSDKSVYIGLTCNFEKRIQQHLKYGPVNEYISKYNLTPKISKITDYIDCESAKEIEIAKIKNYKKRGFNVLNTRAGGEVGGGNLICTYDYCKKEALKYKYKSDFKHGSIGAYTAICKKGWKELCSHMVKKKACNYKYTKEYCFDIAKKYKSLSKFRRENASMCVISRQNGWYEEIIEHMFRKNAKNGYWNNKEKCREVSLKCENRTQFRKKYWSAWNYSIKNNWLDEFF